MKIQKIALAMTNMVQHQPSASHSASENRDAFYLTALVECIAKKLDEQDNLNRQLSAMQQRAENAEADAKKWKEESNSLIGQQDIQIELLQKQVSMLTNALKDAVEEYKKLPHSLGYTITHCQRWERMIVNTQAVADTFMAEERAKVLKKIRLPICELADMEVPHYYDMAISDVIEKVIDPAIAELRAPANRKDE